MDCKIVYVLLNVSALHSYNFQFRNQGLYPQHVICIFDINYFTY